VSDFGPLVGSGVVVAASVAAGAVAAAVLRLPSRGAALVSSFAGGVLLAAVAFELVPDADERAGLGYGVFVPIFFVATGVRLDLNALFANASNLSRVPIFPHRLIDRPRTAGARLQIAADLQADTRGRAATGNLTQLLGRRGLRGARRRRPLVGAALPADCPDPAPYGRGSAARSARDGAVIRSHVSHFLAAQCWRLTASEAQTRSYMQLGCEAGSRRECCSIAKPSHVAWS
jgi:hypothetical protein